MELVDGGERQFHPDGKFYTWYRLAEGIWIAEEERAAKKPKVIKNFREKISKISQYSFPVHIVVR